MGEDIQDYIDAAALLREQLAAVTKERDDVIRRMVDAAYVHRALHERMEVLAVEMKSKWSQPCGKVASECIREALATSTQPPADQDESCVEGSSIHAWLPTPTTPDWDNREWRQLRGLITLEEAYMRCATLTREQFLADPKAAIAAEATVVDEHGAKRMEFWSPGATPPCTPREVVHRYGEDGMCDHCGLGIAAPTGGPDVARALDRLNYGCNEYANGTGHRLYNAARQAIAALTQPPAPATPQAAEDFASSLGSDYDTERDREIIEGPAAPDEDVRELLEAWDAYADHQGAGRLMAAIERLRVRGKVTP